MFARSSKLILPNFHVGNIVEWDDQKGYGFLQLGATKVFLHRREFAEFHRRPALGDRIRFAIGLDAFGRTCAKNAAHHNDGGRLSAQAVLFLFCLLICPALALGQSGGKLSWIAAYGVGVSILSYSMYARDKRRAREKVWRTPENVLHFFEALGGWPGAFIAQRRLRHKCSKRGFQAVFWFIVFAYQVISIGALLHLRVIEEAVSALKSLVLYASG